MAHKSRSSTSSTLPGPVTAPASNLPNPSSSIPLQQISPSSTTSISNEPALNQFSAPWKFEGYKAFSAWMASEDDFFVIRRFQNLNTRTILWMQDQITKIEDEINTMDKKVEDSPKREGRRNDSFRWDEKEMKTRNTLMGDLSLRLHHYNQFVDSYAKIRARPGADKHQIANVQNWLARGAIETHESSFIQHTGDLIPINHRTRTPLGRWLESFQKLHHTSFFRAKHVPDVHQPSPATTYSSNSRFDTFTNTSIIVGGLVMLLAPMWWLEYVSDSTKKLGVMTGFICVFIGLMSTATVNRPFEVVAATAAYSAVLMVFMQVE